MAECPYHGGEKPCRKCLLEKKGEFAHLPLRKDPCPYHGKPHPCIDCFDNRMGQFAHAPRPRGRVPLYIPSRVENSSPPGYGHDHGTRRPCRIRCGVNEGLSVLNTQREVSHFFTDGLVNCTQVIFRSARATFTCHILGTARNPCGWIRWALRHFESEHGRVVACYVVTGDDGSCGAKLIQELRRVFPRLNHIAGCGGYAIDIRSGEVTKTPSFWNPTLQDVAGWSTASDLVYQRYLGGAMIGDALVGDYSENCRSCRNSVPDD